MVGVNAGAFMGTPGFWLSRWHLNSFSCHNLNEYIEIPISIRGWAGERIYGSGVPLGSEDKHIMGSSGKSMTSTMAARVVAKGYISWKTTTKEIFHDTVCIMIWKWCFFNEADSGPLWCSSFVPKLNPGVLCQPWQWRSWPRYCCRQVPRHGGQYLFNCNTE